jgi:hypothetical protein
MDSFKAFGLASDIAHFVELGITLLTSGGVLVDAHYLEQAQDRLLAYQSRFEAGRRRDTDTDGSSEGPVSQHSDELQILLLYCQDVCNRLVNATKSLLSQANATECSWTSSRQALITEWSSEVVEDLEQGLIDRSRDVTIRLCDLSQ